MKKRNYALLLITSCLLLVTACSSKKDPYNSADEQRSRAEKVFKELK